MARYQWVAHLQGERSNATEKALPPQGFHQLTQPPTPAIFFASELSHILCIFGKLVVIFVLPRQLSLIA